MTGVVGTPLMLTGVRRGAAWGTSTSGQGCESKDQVGPSGRIGEAVLVHAYRASVESLRALKTDSRPFPANPAAVPGPPPIPCKRAWMVMAMSNVLLQPAEVTALKEAVAEPWLVVTTMSLPGPPTDSVLV